MILRRETIFAPILIPVRIQPLTDEKEEKYD
jgi:hypothetical protein